MIIRVTSPEIWMTKPVLELLHRAYAKHPTTSFAQALEGLTPSLSDPRAGIFVGHDGKRLCALGVVFLPKSALYAVPQINYAYNDGPVRVHRELVSHIFEFVTQAGYNRVWALFDPAHAAAQQRLNRRFGASHVAAVLCEFDLTKKQGIKNAGNIRGQLR